VLRSSAAPRCFLRVRRRSGGARECDEQYAEYLSRERKSAIAAAFTRKQQQLQHAAPEGEKKSAVPLPVSKPRAATTVGIATSRPKPPSCGNDAFSCNWPRLAEGIKDIKRIFGSSPDKARRGRPPSELATSNQ
jgi:hypothetical protein